MKAKTTTTTQPIVRLDEIIDELAHLYREADQILDDEITRRERTGNLQEATPLPRRL
jgi:hypothetical protein